MPAAHHILTPNPRAAFFRVTVDGGTDVWLNFKKSYCKTIPVKNVDLISGDFDSISGEAMTIAKKLQMNVVHTPDQNETDFSKSLMEVERHIKATSVRSIVVVSQTSGRLDQILACINTLHRSQRFTSATQIYLLSDNSLSFLLQPGTHLIHIPAPLVAKQDWCALIPFQGATQVKTTGLKWNIKNQTMQFGSLVTTSNTYEPSTTVVEVCTDKALLWSMGITLL